MPPHQITQLGMARTFQNIRLFHNMSSVENVQVGMHARLKGGIWASILRTPRHRREEDGALEKARAPPLRVCGAWTTNTRRTSPTATSDGSRSRGRSPPILCILLDEPTAGMNPQETAEFTAFVGGCARSAG